MATTIFDKPLDHDVSEKLNTGNVYNGLDQESSGYALDARQGKALNQAIGTLSSLDTTDKTNLVAAINEVVGKINIKRYTVPLNAATPNSITVSGIGVFWVYGGTNGTTAYITTETAQGNKTDTYTVAGSANLMVPVRDGQKMNYTGGPYSAASLYALEFPVVTG